MKWIVRPLLISIYLLALSARAQNSGNYAITNVTVISMTGESSRTNQTVFIERGIINRISANVTNINKKYVLIDGTGKFLLPGFFDMHAHFFQEQGDNKNTCETELKMMLANGLTTVRILAGHPSYLEARANVKNGRWVGPNLIIASPQFVGEWRWADAFRNYEVVGNKAQAIAAVKKCKQSGYDEIKITFLVTRDAYEGVVMAAKEVGLKVTGHVGPRVKLPVALEAGQQVEHMDQFIEMLLPDTTYNHGQSVSDLNIWSKRAWETVPYLDENKIPELVDRVKKSGIYVTPTNYFFFSSFGKGQTEDEYRKKPDYAFIPPNLKQERWEVRQRYLKNLPPESSRIRYENIRKRITRELWQAGVPLMAGSDSPEWFLVQGFSVHDELETFVNAGLSPFGALQTATVNPARYAGLIKSTGTIEEGKKADLLLLSEDPLKDIRNTRRIMAVFAGGHYFDQAKIKQLLDEARSLGQP